MVGIIAWTPLFFLSAECLFSLVTIYFFFCWLMAHVQENRSNMKHRIVGNCWHSLQSQMHIKLTALLETEFVRSSIYCETNCVKVMFAPQASTFSLIKLLMIKMNNVFLSFFFFLRAIALNMWSNHSCKWCNRQELLQINELINVLLEAILSNISNYNNITATKWGLLGLFCLKWTSDLPLSPSSSSQAVIECKLELFLSTHHKHTQSVSGRNWHAAHDSCGETQAFIQHCAVCWTGDNEQQRCFILK